MLPLDWLCGISTCMIFFLCHFVFCLLDTISFAEQVFTFFFSKIIGGTTTHGRWQKTFCWNCKVEQLICKIYVVCCIHMLQGFYILQVNTNKISLEAEVPASVPHLQAKQDKQLIPILKMK